MNRVNLEYRRIWKESDEERTLLRGTLTVDKEGIVNYLVMKGKRNWGTYVSFSLQDNSSSDESYNFIGEDTTSYFQKRVVITDDVYREVIRRLAYPVQLLPKFLGRYKCYMFFVEDGNTYFLDAVDFETIKRLKSDIHAFGISARISGLLLSKFIGALEGGDLRRYFHWDVAALVFMHMDPKIRRDIFRVLVEAYGNKFNIKRFISKSSVITFMAEHPESIIIFDELTNLLEERSAK